MPIIQFEGISITAISSCVPNNIISNSDLSHLLNVEEIDKLSSTIGIFERRYADDQTTSSDLCFQAADNIFKKNLVSKSEINGIIFVSQTPDYRQASTAPILQHRLGLNKNIIAFDINLACSGYVYGLSVAFAIANSIGINNILLLVGETMSKTISKNDRVTTPLFGDAGTATLIQKCNNKIKTYFSLNTDGQGSDILRIPFGGYRHPSCELGFIKNIDADGNVLSGEDLHMKGMDVFNFAIKTVPQDISYLLKHIGKDECNIDYFIFHQANKFLTDFLAKKLKINLKKVPYSIQKYGNTSSASIPLTISSELHSNEINSNKCILLSGFGAGLSWGTCITSMEGITILKPIIYE
jgi:3-oxoacyl-[acyl-carrier-protein] synthase-3